MTNVSSPFKHFSTDKKKESGGVWIDYGDYGFQVRRLGSSNKKFTKMMETELRPHKAQIRRKAMNDDIADAISIKVFCTTVLISWRRVETAKDGTRTWIEGMMPDARGKDVEYSVQNASDLLKQLPDLFDDLYQQATDFATFNAAEEAGTAKN